MEFILPKKKSEYVKQNAVVQILFGPSKVGKTHALSQLDEALFIDLERGTSYIKALKVQVDNIDEYTEFMNQLEYQKNILQQIYNEFIKAFHSKFNIEFLEFPKDRKEELDNFIKDFNMNTFNNFKQSSPDLTEDRYLDTFFLDSFEQIPKKYPYKRLILDNLTVFEEWCKELVIVNFNNSQNDESNHVDDIGKIAFGGGYGLLRIEMKNQIDRLKKCCEELILIGHVKDKVINKNGTELNIEDLNATGKIGTLLCANADAIGLMYRNLKQQLVVSYVKSESSSNTGARPPHLRGREFIIGDPNIDPDKFNWDEIYLVE